MFILGYRFVSLQESLQDAALFRLIGLLSEIEECVRHKRAARPDSVLER